MGTTTVLSIYHQQYLFIGHVGDLEPTSSETAIAQLTDDHSLVNEQPAGLITEQQAQTSRFKNIITRSVGFEDVDVDGSWWRPDPVMRSCCALMGCQVWFLIKKSMT